MVLILRFRFALELRRGTPIAVCAHGDDDTTLYQLYFLLH